MDDKGNPQILQASKLADEAAQATNDGTIVCDGFLDCMMKHASKGYEDVGETLSIVKEEYIDPHVGKISKAGQHAFETGKAYASKTLEGYPKVRECLSSPNACWDNIKTSTNNLDTSNWSEMARDIFTSSLPEILFCIAVTTCLILLLSHLFKWKKTTLFLVAVSIIILTTVCFIPDAPTQINGYFKEFLEWVGSVDEQLKLTEKISAFYQQALIFLKEVKNDVYYSLKKAYDTLKDPVSQIILCIISPVLMTRKDSPGTK